jgi:hypothetical protein
MRRLTRRIGLFGGPAALMPPAVGVKKPPPKETAAESATRPGASSADGSVSAEPARKRWFRWLWKSESGGGSKAT